MAPINPPNLRLRSFASLLKKAGLAHIRFHGLRYTFRPLMFTRGGHPKMVQEILGHSQISSTLDTYSPMFC